jgi:hypothetical protein
MSAYLNLLDARANRDQENSDKALALACEAEAAGNPARAEMLLVVALRAEARASDLEEQIYWASLR